MCAYLLSMVISRMFNLEHVNEMFISLKKTILLVAGGLLAVDYKVVPVFLYERNNNVLTGTSDLEELGGGNLIIKSY